MFKTIKVKHFKGHTESMQVVLGDTVAGLLVKILTDDNTDNDCELTLQFSYMNKVILSQEIGSVEALGKMPVTRLLRRLEELENYANRKVGVL